MRFGTRLSWIWTIVILEGAWKDVKNPTYYREYWWAGLLYFSYLNWKCKTCLTVFKTSPLEDKFLIFMAPLALLTQSSGSGKVYKQAQHYSGIMI